jgi:Protein of unknown function (DUF2793)
MNETFRHRLPLLATAQAQKEVTHNEALLAIDRRLQIAVATHGANAPPAAPIAGECHIVGALPVGAWAGQSDSIAMHDGFGWQFTVPTPGFVAYVGDAAVLAVYDAGWHVGAWPVAALRIGSRIVLGAAPVAVSVPAGGSIIDAELRSAFAELLLALAAQGVID